MPRERPRRYTKPVAMEIDSVREEIEKARLAGNNNRVRLMNCLVVGSWDWMSGVDLQWYKPEIAATVSLQDLWDIRNFGDMMTRELVIWLGEHKLENEQARAWVKWLDDRGRQETDGPVAEW